MGLPAEVLNEVFGQCSQDMLTKCALVNETFLDLARSHLYRSFNTMPRLAIHTMTCPARAEIFKHTKHLRTDIPPFAFLGEIYQLGQLETLTLEYWSMGSEDHESFDEYLQFALDIFSLPSFRRFRYLTKKYINPRLSTLALMSSPKLQDLQIWSMSPVSFTSSFIHHLDTLRTISGMWDVLHSLVDLNVLRRLSLIVGLDVTTTNSFMKNWFNSTSHNLTHLALDIKIYSDITDSELVETFIEIQTLRFLQSFTIFVNQRSLYMCPLKFASLLIEQTSPEAPLRSIHLFIRPLPEISQTDEHLDPHNLDPNNPAWQILHKIMENRLPRSQLFVYFDMSRVGPPLESRFGSEPPMLADFELPKHIIGVERIFDTWDVLGRPFFSGEPADDVLRPASAPSPRGGEHW